MTTAELEELIWKIDLMLSDTPAMLFTTEESRWDDFLQRVQPASWHNPSGCGVCDCSRHWLPQEPATILTACLLDKMSGSPRATSAPQILIKKLIKMSPGLSPE
jgi:hypothetical protein